MSYQVLARKWRPSNFQELVGQEHVVSALVNALTQNRLHHAYLFTGTRGVGKTTLARILSKSLNCDTGITATPCGQCTTCQDIEQGKYVDLLEIDAASRTKVEDTREILDNVQYKPSRGRFKVYLIDEVHMLSKHSFNALLKTLEEPPPHVKFLLATTDPQKLPITVLSRCLQFNLKAMTKEQVAGQLSHVLTQESINFDKGAIALLAKAARGSMRDALSLTDQAVAQGNGSVNQSQVAEMLGTIDKSLVLKLLLSLLSADAEKVFNQVEEIALFSPDYGQLLSELQSLVHQIALAQLVPAAAQIDQENSEAVLKLAQQIPAEMLQLFYQIIVSGKKELIYAPDGKSGLEMTLLRLLAFKPEQADLSFDDIEVKPSTAQPKVQSSSALPESKPEAPQQQVAEQRETLETNTQAEIEEQKAETELNQQQEQILQQAETLTPVSSEAESLPQSEVLEDASIQNESWQQHPQQADSASDIESSDGNQDPFNPHDPEYQRMQDSMFAEQPQPVKDYQPQEMPEPVATPVEQMPQAFNTAPVESGAMQQVAPEETTAEQQTPHSNEPLTDTQAALQSRNMLRSQKKRLEDSGKKSGDAAGSSIAARIESLAKASGATGQAAKAETPQPEMEQAVTEAQVDAIMGADDFPVPDVSAQPQAAPMQDTPPWETGEAVVETVPIEETANAPSAYQAMSLDDDMPMPQADMATQAIEMAQAQQIQQPVDAPQHPVISAPVGSGKLAEIVNNSMSEEVLYSAQLDQWAQMTLDMELRGLVRQLAINSDFYVQDNQVTLVLDPTQKHLDNPNNVQSITASLSKILNKDIELTIQLGQAQASPMMIQKQIDGLRYFRAEQSIHQDAWVQNLIAGLNATLLDGSIKALPQA